MTVAEADEAMAHEAIRQCADQFQHGFYLHLGLGTGAARKAALQFNSDDRGSSGHQFWLRFTTGKAFAP